MPMPLSLMVSVLASLSKPTRTSRLGASSYRALLFKASKRSLSQASEAFEISSRRKISLLEYSEWVTRCSNWATSAWKESVFFWVMAWVEVDEKCFGQMRPAPGHFKIGWGQIQTAVRRDRRQIPRLRLFSLVHPHRACGMCDRLLHWLIRDSPTTPAPCLSRFVQPRRSACFMTVDLPPSSAFAA